MNYFKILFLLCLINGFQQNVVRAQEVVSHGDTVIHKFDTIRSFSGMDDTAKAKKKIPKIFNPNKAIIRSAILPGWGQIYNHEYWKLPLVYGLLAIPTVTFIYNNSYYQKTKFAYQAVWLATYSGDSSLLKKISSKVLNKSGSPLSLSSYATYRNEFRRDRDYSVFWFLIIWGLQVVDATVSANLKTFDVAPDLTMQIKPMMQPSGAGFFPGVGFVFNIGRQHPKAMIARQ